MSHNLEMPESIFRALNEAAEASGMTPVAWIAAHLPAADDDSSQAPDVTKACNLKERWAGRIGRIRSGGGLRLSESTGDKFTDYLLAKKRAGHL
jgi:hypothetical protein